MAQFKKNKQIRVDWAGLHPDMLFTIVKRIEVAKDFMAFRSVCATWRAVGQHKGSAQSLRPLRWIVLPPHHRADTSCEIYSLNSDKIFSVSLPEETKGKQMIETNGWFVTGSLEKEMFLLHPLSRHVIPLPHKTAFEDYSQESNYFGYTEKAVLSTSPSFSPNDYVLMIIAYPHKLCYWKPGDRAWTIIGRYSTSFQDIIYCRGQFYAVSDLGVVYVCDVKGSNPTELICVCKIPLEPMGDYRKFRLAECVGKLMVVIDGLLRYKVYEVDLSGKGGFKEVDNLGDRTIFACIHDTICIENSKFPSGIINPYKADVNLKRMNMGLFDLKVGKVGSFCYHVESWTVFPSE